MKLVSVTALHLLLYSSLTLNVFSGEADLEQLMEQMNQDTLEYAAEMERAYNERCSHNTFRRCSYSHYDECITDFPEQLCAGGNVYSRPDCFVDGMPGCNGFFDFTVSNVRLSPDMDTDYDGNPLELAAIEDMCYSLQAEDHMVQKYKDDKSYWAGFGVEPPQVHFGSENGLFRMFPARQSVECRKYDPRRRPWYVAATSGPKDVVLILDTSSSMGNKGRMDLMKQAAKHIVDTLTTADHIGVIQFSSDSSAVTEDHMLQATKENRNLVYSSIDELSPDGSTNFVAAFEEAFQMIGRSKELGFTSSCNMAILFLTDGEMTLPAQADVQDVIQVIQKWEGQLSINPFIFLFSLGSESKKQSAKDLKQIACATGGIWSHVDDGGDLLTTMGNYYKVFAVGLGAGENKNFVAWVEPYEFATGKILGTTVSAPIFDRSVTPNLLVGVFGVDFTVAAMDQALGVEAGSRETLNKLVERSLAFCPQVNLTDCDIQGLRYAAGGADALCENECMNFTGIEPQACITEFEHPALFWKNTDNKDKSFPERACCGVIGATKTDGEFSSSQELVETDQCIDALEELQAEVSSNDAFKVKALHVMDFFVIIFCSYSLLYQLMCIEFK